MGKREMRRILYVCIQSSPHTARWINCVADAGYDFHMFGQDQHPPNKLLRNVTLHWPAAAPTSIPQLDWRVRGHRFFAHARRDPVDALRILRYKLALQKRVRSLVASAATPPPECLQSTLATSLVAAS